MGGGGSAPPRALTTSTHATGIASRAEEEDKGPHVLLCAQILAANVRSDGNQRIQGGRYFIYRPPRTVFHPPSYLVVASTRPRRSARRRCNSARTARALTLVVASHLNHGRARFSWPSAIRRAYSRGQDEAGGGAGWGLLSPCSPACRIVKRAREPNRRRGSRLPHARRSSTNHRSESAATEASHTDGPGRSTVVSVRDDGGGYCALVYHLDHLVRSARMFSCPPFGQQFDDATGEGDGWSQVLVPSTSVASFSCMHQNYPSLSL